MRKTLKNVLIITACFFLSCTILWATTAFTSNDYSYNGRISPIHKYTATITPTNPNDVNSSNLSPDVIYGIIHQVVIQTTGTDANHFTILLRNENGIPFFQKSDCNTFVMPLIYTLYETDSAGNSCEGIIAGGQLYFDVNNVEVNHVQSITITLYYSDPKY